MKKVTYPTDDGGAIHEYTKKKRSEESVLDEININIHITGSELDKINSIDIYFKEDE